MVNNKFITYTAQIRYVYDQMRITYKTIITNKKL